MMKKYHASVSASRWPLSVFGVKEYVDLYLVLFNPVGAVTLDPSLGWHIITQGLQD